MRPVVLLALTFGLMVAPHASQAAPAPAAPVAGRTAPDPAIPSVEEMRADLRAGLVISGGELMKWAMDEYAPEFRTFEDDLIGDLRAERITLEQAQQRAYTFVSTIRERGLAYVQKAPDADLMTFLNAQIALMRDLQKVNINACYEMGENGSLSLPTLLSLPQTARDRITAYANLQVGVVKAGKATPTIRQPVTEVEAERVIVQFLDKGGSAAWVRGLGARNFENVDSETRCQSSILFLETLLAQPGTLAPRMMFAG